MFKYPYTDLESVNLDYILKMIIELDGKVDDFTALNKITWHGSYDSGRSYDVWSIVSDGNNAYISIKTTAAGIPLNNSEYWQQVANYTALYADCQTRLDALTDGISNPRNKRVIVIADSYGTGDQWDPVAQAPIEAATTGWINYFNTYIGIPSANYYASAVTGSGFTVGTTVAQQLAALNITDKASITDIVVALGYNDKDSTVDAILQGISSFCATCRTQYPNALVSIACIGWSKDAGVRNSITNSTLKAYTQCGRFGARYLSNAQYIMHQYELFCADGFHPTQEGQYMIACKLADAFISGSCDIINLYADNIANINTTDFTGGSMTFYEGLNNGLAVEGFDGTGFTYRNATTLNSNSVITLASADPKYICGNLNSNHNMIMGPVWFHCDQGEVYVNCRIWFGYDSSSKKTVLKINPAPMSAALTNCTIIYIYGRSWTVNSLAC